ncbi:hypothetical protein P3T97_14150 (plasmid) [Mammaliicoccus sciuri]|uniref:hypothetical protein n=1 Tax=Mammaliicoccus sciuri TaxID=1296 RepID=UPI0023AF33BF|nr:hypothetical protein [Mammaliicoccus sciuri]MDE9962250.1 hypothetical protein [Staphylococcus pseudintermedius]WQJ67260.1 hypothetical protein P3T97_14150 [Mammaliicoccus sciuri]
MINNLKEEFKDSRKKNYYIASIDWLVGLNRNEKSKLIKLSVEELEMEYKNTIISKNEEFYEKENINHLIESHNKVNNYRRIKYD